MVYSDNTKNTVDVLLVEDDAGSRKLVRSALLDHNSNIKYRIEEVQSLAHANERLANKKYDNVVLDLGLPDSSGIETLQSIRQACPDVPIVVLSGTSDHEIEMKAIHHGADYFILKGSTLRDILGRSICYSIQRQQTKAMSQNNNHLQRHIDLLKSQIREVKETLSEQVTCRNLAEDSLSKLNDEYGILLDSIPAMVWQIDKAGNIVRTNIKGSELIGKKPYEVTGENFYQLFSADSYILKNQLKEVLASGKSQHKIAGIFKTDTSELKSALTDIIPFREKNGDISGFILYARQMHSGRNKKTYDLKKEAPFNKTTTNATEAFQKNRVDRKLYDKQAAHTENNYSGKILIVEDDSLNRVLINANFREMDLDITFAKNGRQAIEMAKTTSFDMIMSCLQMHEMGGLELAEKLKEMEINTPTIAMTTDFRAATIKECTDAGFDGYIFKPINKRDLFGLLNKYLQTAPVN